MHTITVNLSIDSSSKEEAVKNIQNWFGGFRPEYWPKGCKQIATPAWPAGVKNINIPEPSPKDGLPMYMDDEIFNIY
jgi:hypothetical protein